MRRTCLVLVTALLMVSGFAAAQDAEYADPVVSGSHELPAYPPAALAAGFEGVVTVAAVVNADGSLGAVEVIEDSKPHLGFGDASIQAIRNWHFAPAQLDGQPVDSVGAFVFRFHSVGRVDPSAYVRNDFLLSRAIVGGVGVNKRDPMRDLGFSPASHVKKQMQKYGKPPGTPFALYDRRDLVPEPIRSIDHHRPN